MMEVRPGWNELVADHGLQPALIVSMAGRNRFGISSLNFCPETAILLAGFVTDYTIFRNNMMWYLVN